MPPKKEPSEAIKKDWTWSMKYALHVLDKNYELLASQRTELFKIIFDEEVSAWVVTDDRLQYLIRTQLSEGRQQRMQQWKDIYRAANKPADIASRKAIEASVLEAVSKMEQELAASADVESSTTRKTRSAKRTKVWDASQSVHPTPTPLSRRAAIGSWNPESTDEDTQNAKSALKRRKITSLHVSASPSSLKASRVDHRRANSTLVRTPQKQKRLTAPKVSFQQAHGTIIQRTPEQIAKAQEDLPEVLEAEAHQPMNGLLYRYWIEDPNDLRNSRAGIVSRKYSRARVNFNQPTPLCNKLDWEEVFYHIDRSGKGIDWPSPFISTSNNLLWTVQKALKQLEHYPDTLRISLIDTHVLERKSIFHVLPYHRNLLAKAQFTSGSWRYAGTHEFLVHRRIPGEAIIHTFKMQDLLHLVQHDQDAYDPIIERILRLDNLDVRRDLKKDIHPKLRQHNIPLSAVVAIGVAKLTAFAGIKSNSNNSDHIQAFVAEIIQGWALKLKHRTPEQWSSLATSYANALFECSHRPRSLMEEMMIKRAFLGGVFWGSSKHFNPRHSPEHIRSTYKTAKEIGLEDPGKMTMDEVAALQMNLIMYEKTQQRHLPGHRTQLLLEGPVK